MLGQFNISTNSETLNLMNINKIFPELRFTSRKQQLLERYESQKLSSEQKQKIKKKQSYTTNKLKKQANWILATTPKKELLNIEKENKMMDEVGGKQFWNMKRKPTNISIGDRIYFVKNGFIDNYQIIEDLKEGNMFDDANKKEYNGYNLILSYPPIYLKNKIPYKGFQGFRYIKDELRLSLEKAEPINKQFFISIKDKLKKQAIVKDKLKKQSQKDILKTKTEISNTKKKDFLEVLRSIAKYTDISSPTTKDLIKLIDTEEFKRFVEYTQQELKRMGKYILNGIRAEHYYRWEYVKQGDIISLGAVVSFSEGSLGTEFEKRVTKIHVEVPVEFVVAHYQVTPQVFWESEREFLVLEPKLKVNSIFCDKDFETGEVINCIVNGDIVSAKK